MALFERPGGYQGFGRPRLMGPRVSSPRQRAQKRSGWGRIEIELYGRRVELLVKTWVCLWYTVAGTQPVHVVLTRDPRGRFDDRAFFATDSDLSAEEILLRVSHRWDLEVSFRNVKQILGLEDPRNGWWRRPRGQRRNTRRPGAEPHAHRGRLAAEHTAPFAWTVYGIVIVWYLRHGRPAADAARVRARQPWYRHKRDPSFADMVTALRLALIVPALSRDPLPRRVRRKVAAILEPLCAAAA